jgi:hypothetical protein
MCQQVVLAYKLLLACFLRQHRNFISVCVWMFLLLLLLLLLEYFVWFVGRLRDFFTNLIS